VSAYEIRSHLSAIPRNVSLSVCYQRLCRPIKASEHTKTNGSCLSLFVPGRKALTFKLQSTRAEGNPILIFVKFLKTRYRCVPLPPPFQEPIGRVLQHNFVPLLNVYLLMNFRHDQMKKGNITKTHSLICHSLTQNSDVIRLNRRL
jgi:hypothetical protein